MPPSGPVWNKGNRARASSSTWHSRTSPGRPIRSGRSGIGRIMSTVGSRSRYRRCSPTTRRARWPQRRIIGACAAPQRLHQDSRHSGRASGDRGNNLRRHSDQRDTALLPRALRGGGRRVPARHRAADRRRPRPARARSPRLHQPLDGAVEKHGPRLAQERAGDRDRGADTRGGARAALFAVRSALTTSVPGRSAFSGPAPGQRTRRPRMFFT